MLYAGLDLSRKHLDFHATGLDAVRSGGGLRELAGVFGVALLATVFNHLRTGSSDRFSPDAPGWRL
jgi:hypothetical protein